MTCRPGCPAPGPALGTGLIDGYRARLIWRPTQHLTDADAARADESLAGLAPGLRYDQLARRATAVAMKLDPEAFKRGKKQARADRQRVTAGREESGNAFLWPRTGHRGRARRESAHRRARRRAAPRRAARHPAAAAGAGLLDLTQGLYPLLCLTGSGGRASLRGRALAARHLAKAARRRVPAARRALRTQARAKTDRTGGHDSTDAGDSDEDDASLEWLPDMTEWQHERCGTREDDDYLVVRRRPGPPACSPADQPDRPGRTADGWSTAPARPAAGTTRPRRHPPPAPGCSTAPRTRCASGFPLSQRGDIS